MTDAATLLNAYDDQLRTDAETPSALSVTEHGPLRLVTFARGRGFVTYRDLDGADEAGIRDLVAAAVAHFTADPDITRVEWKTRGHDHAPGLHEALVDAGFEPEEQESIMMGEARLLAVDVGLPDGGHPAHGDRRGGRARHERHGRRGVRRPGLGRDGPRRCCAGSPLRDGMELWVAEADGRMVSAGRLEPVPDTDVAGIWGGVDPRAVAGPRHLPGADGGPRTVGAAARASPSSTATPRSSRARSSSAPAS